VQGIGHQQIAVTGRRPPAKPFGRGTMGRWFWSQRVVTATTDGPSQYPENGTRPRLQGNNTGCKLLHSEVGRLDELKAKNRDLILWRRMDPPPDLV